MIYIKHDGSPMPSFVEIGRLVSEKKVFTIYGHDGIIGHVTWTIYTHFVSPFLMKFEALIGPEKMY